MKVLIVFATYSSGTDLATDVIKRVLESAHIEVIKKNIKDITPTEINNYTDIILASPSWRTRKGDGMPHEFFLDYMDTVADGAYNGKKFAVMGLGDTAYTHFCGAVNELEKFIQARGGELLTESLRIDGFYFAQEQNEKEIEAWSVVIAKSLL